MTSPALVSGYLDPVYTDAAWEQDFIFMAAASGDEIDPSWAGCGAALALAPTSSMRRDVDSFELTSAAGDLVLWTDEARVGIRVTDCSGYTPGEYGWEMRQLRGDGSAVAVAVGKVVIAAGLSDPPTSAILPLPGASKGTIVVRPASGGAATGVGPKGSPASQAESKADDFTAVADRTYLLDASGGAFTATLPATPATGDAINFEDATGDCDVNVVTIARNGQTIGGEVANFSFNVAWGACRFTFSGETWLYRRV